MCSLNQELSTSSWLIPWTRQGFGNILEAYHTKTKQKHTDNYLRWLTCDCTLTVAPCCTSIFTISSCPARDAMWRAVLPFCKTDNPSNGQLGVQGAYEGYLYTQNGSLLKTQGLALFLMAHEALYVCNLYNMTVTQKGSCPDFALAKWNQGMIACKCHNDSE